MLRPDWDTVWIEFAQNIARRSIDPKHKVGAVIVTTDNTERCAVVFTSLNNSRSYKAIDRSGIL